MLGKREVESIQNLRKYPGRPVPAERARLSLLRERAAKECLRSRWFHLEELTENFDPVHFADASACSLAP